MSMSRDGVIAVLVCVNLEKYFLSALSMEVMEAVLDFWEQVYVLYLYPYCEVIPDQCHAQIQCRW